MLFFNSSHLKHANFLTSVGIILFSATASSSVFAGAVQLTSARQLTGITTTVPYSAYPDYYYGAPYTVSVPGDDLTFSADGGMTFYQVGQDIGNNFSGNFPVGTEILNATHIPPTPVDILFSHGVQEVGFQAQEGDVTANGLYTLDIRAYDGSSLLTEFTVDGDAYNGNPASFVGLQAQDGSAITEVTVSPLFPYSRLALGEVTFGQAPAPVPESSTLASFGLLLIIGLGALGMARWRKMAAHN